MGGVFRGVTQNNIVLYIMRATKMGASASASASATTTNKPKIILVGEHDHSNATGRNSIINTLKKNKTIHFFYESPITEGLYDGVAIIPLEPYLESEFNPDRLYMKQNTPSRFSDALYLMSAMFRKIIKDGVVIAQEDAMEESTRYLEVLFSTANDELRERLTQFHNIFPENKEEYYQFIGDSILQNIQEESNGTGNLQEIMQQNDSNPIPQLQILRDNIMLDTIEKYTTSHGLNSESTFVVIVGNDHIENMKQLLEARGYHITSVVETTNDAAKMTDKVKDMVRAIIVGKRGGNVRKRYKQTKKSKRRNKSKSKRRRSKSKRRMSKSK